MKRAIAALLLLSLSKAEAQDDLAKKAEELKQFFSTPAVGWTDHIVAEQIRKYLLIYLDMLWDPDFHRKVSAMLPQARPEFEVRVAGSLRSPYVDGNVVKVPVEYVAYLYPIGQLVGHDLSVDKGSLALDRPLLSTAYRQTKLIPLLSPLNTYLDNGGQEALSAYLPCPATEKSCQFLQNMSAMGLVTFLVLHEVSHTFLGHKPGPEIENVPNEIAADRNAARVMRALADEFQSLPPRER